MNSIDFYHYPNTDYEKNLSFSNEIDKKLGLKIKETEELVRNKNFELEAWKELAPEHLQTPYNEFIDILKYINVQDSDLYVDLGAGYGRMGFVLNALNPKAQFIGYELAPQRVEEGNRVFSFYELENAKLICQNIIDENFSLPSAKAYFLYDFGTKEQLKRIIPKLDELSQKQAITLVARGRVRGLLDEYCPWLLKDKQSQYQPYSVYRYT